MKNHVGKILLAKYCWQNIVGKITCLPENNTYQYYRVELLQDNSNQDQGKIGATNSWNAEDLYKPLCPDYLKDINYV